MSTREPGSLSTLLVISNDSVFQKEVYDLVTHCDLASRYTVVPSSYDNAPRHDTSHIILIDVSEGHQGHVEFVRRFCASQTSAKIVCAGSNLTVDSILNILKLGVHHFLKRPFDPMEFRSLLFSLSMDGQPQEHVPGQKGKIITVYSLKGGSGVTLFSINLAVALAKLDKKKRVAICDLAPQAGDVSTYLNLNPQYSIRDLLDNVDRLDSSLLEGVLTDHESSVRVLASAGLDQEPLTTNGIPDWSRILDTIQHNYSFVVIDTAHTDQTFLQHTLLQSDAILLMGNLDVPSLKGILTGLSKLNRLQIDSSKIHVVINRFNAKNQLDIKDFQKNSKCNIRCKLPNDYVTCIESINTGKPINLHQENSEIGKKIKEFAQELAKEISPLASAKSVEEKPAVAEGAKKGLWGLL